MAEVATSSSSWPKPTSIAQSFKTLETLRVRHVHASQQVLENSDYLFASNVDVQKKLGDDYWAFLEQLARAALDAGRDGLAEDCITRLDERFPNAPRVQVLQGMRKEAAGKLDDALKLYDLILEVDETNAGIWKRRVAVYKQMGDTQKAVEDLCAYVDTFYTDVEGWLELAELYAGVNSYTHALQALSHAMVLAPQNPFYVLQFAENASKTDDSALALKMYLRAVEMIEDDEDGGFHHDDNDIARRAWSGVDLCTRRLLERSAAVTTSGLAEHNQPPSQAELEGLAELATERLRGA